VCIDSDDPTIEEYMKIKLPDGWTRYIAEPIGLGAVINRAFSSHPNESWYGMITDDHVPVTRGWDSALISAAGSNFVSYCADGIVDEAQASACVLGGDFARELGWIILPGLVRIYGDNVITEIAREKNALRYLPDVRVEHWHFSNGMAKMDETYKKPEAESDKAIYDRWVCERKNQKKVTFCCVQSNNYCGRGVEYVNTLFDMVKRNMPGGWAFRFVCLTDDPKGLHEHIETIDLPPDLERWYGKLYLFKRGLFADGERVVFFDLDTLIMGSLEEVVSYKGQFATLQDFFYPDRIGPAVMLWEAGDYTSGIWEEWVVAGKPRNPMGDLWWLNQLDQGRFAKKADKLQKLFPKSFVSYKVSCHPLPPKGSKVICFHGLPRPHEEANRVEWVDMAWRVGGAVRADLEVVANTSNTVASKNVSESCKLDIPWLRLEQPNTGSVAVVGGGPSLKRMLEELRALQKSGTRIFATNGSHAYLKDNGIEADDHIIIDARPENVSFLKYPAKHYFLASQCAPEVFEKVNSVTLVHMNTRDILQSIPDNEKPVNLISSGTTVGLAAMGIAYCLGYRRIYVYGMDSSYEDSRHVYPQGLNDQDRVTYAIAGGRRFKCALWMVAQVEDFQKLVTELANDDCEIHVRSAGMLGHVSWIWAQNAAA